MSSKEEIFNTLTTVNSTVENTNNVLNKAENTIGNLNTTIENTNTVISKTEQVITKLNEAAINTPIPNANKLDVGVEEIMALASNSISSADTAIAHTDTMVTLFLGAITVLTIGLTLIVQWWLSKNKKEEIEKAIDNLLNDVETNNELKEKIVNTILKNDDFFIKFNAIIEQKVSDKADEVIEIIKAQHGAYSNNDGDKQKWEVAEDE